MKKIRIFLSAVLVLFSNISVFAFDCEVNSICYNFLSEDEVEVTKNPNWYTGDIVIPESIQYEDKNYRVIAIGQSAFMNTAKGKNNPTSVTMPISIISIGRNAFRNCKSLTYIVIPDGVRTIGSDAFYACKGLTSVIVGNGVDSIGNNAFDGCTNLNTFSIGKSVTSIGEMAFRDCSNLTSVTINCENVGSWFRGISSITELSLGDNVKTIDNEAFKECYHLKSVIFSDGLTSIGNSAFEFCQELTSVNIPRNVSFIGEKAFAGCHSLSIINVDNENPIYDSRDNCNAIIEKETNTLIIGCQSSSIPTTVTSIGKKAFYSCNGLLSITIPSNVTSIGVEAFSYSQLQSIILGENVSHLDSCVFSYCRNLRSLYCFTEEVPSAVDNTFGDNSHNINNATLYVPETAIDKYRAASPWNQFGEIKPLSGEITTKIDSLYYDVNIDNNTATVIRPIGNQFYSGDTSVQRNLE